MSVDLGRVTVFPWDNLLSLYSYSVSPDYTAYGGFKTVNGECNVAIKLKAINIVTLNFPIPENSFETFIELNRNPTKITFNGTISLNANDELFWNCVYKVKGV